MRVTPELTLSGNRTTRLLANRCESDVVERLRQEILVRTLRCVTCEFAVAVSISANANGAQPSAPVSHVTTLLGQRCRLMCIERNSRRKRKSHEQTDHHDCISTTIDPRDNTDHQSAAVYALGPFQVGNSVAFALELVSLRQ